MALRRLVARGPAAGVDTRSVGTMSQFLREVFAETDQGFTRGEIRDLLRSQPAFCDRIDAHKRAHHYVIDNLLFRGDIEKRDGKLYATPVLRVQRRGLP